jgi:hypothetical protein
MRNVLPKYHLLPNVMNDSGDLQLQYEFEDKHLIHITEHILPLA